LFINTSHFLKLLAHTILGTVLQDLDRGFTREISIFYVVYFVEISVYLDFVTKVFINENIIVSILIGDSNTFDRRGQFNKSNE
jgi:hypothetical protein